jgi:hypothetical protein
LKAQGGCVSSVVGEVQAGLGAFSIAVLGQPWRGELRWKLAKWYDPAASKKDDQKAIRLRSAGQLPTAARIFHRLAVP